MCVHQIEGYDCGHVYNHLIPHPGANELCEVRPEVIMPVQGDCGCEGEASNSEDDLYALPESHTSPNHGPHVRVHGPPSSPLTIEIEPHLAPPHVLRYSSTTPAPPSLPTRISRGHATPQAIYTADGDWSKARPDVSRRDQDSEDRKAMEMFGKAREEFEKALERHTRRAVERIALERHEWEEKQEEEARRDDKRKAREHREMKKHQIRAEKRDSRRQGHKMSAEHEAERQKKKAESDARYEEIKREVEGRRVEIRAEIEAVQERERSEASRRDREDLDTRPMPGSPWDSHHSQEDFEALQILLGAASLSEATRQKRMEVVDLAACEEILQLARDNVRIAQLQLAVVERAIEQWRVLMDLLRV